MAQLVSALEVLPEALSARAEEPRLIALLEFLGPGGAIVRGEIMQLAAANFRVASTAKLAGLPVRDFALDHGLDVVVQGTVRKREGGYQIRVRFHGGATGRAIGGVTARVGEPALDRDAKSRIQRELGRILSALVPSSTADETPGAATHPGTSP